VPSDPIGRARRITSPDEAIGVYADWAASYDDDVFETLGFTGTDRIADLLADHLPGRDVPVLDLGCGTGAAGVRLRQHGFTMIDGIDISPQMLAVAAGKGVYRQLVVGDLTAPLPIAPASYGASVSAGTFTTGHVGPAALPGIVGVLAPGAVVAWVIGAASWPTFEQALASTPLEVVAATRERIWPGGDDEAIMLVARR